MKVLKPCPFCGEIGRLIEKSIGFAVQCVNSECECAFTNWRNTSDEAVTEWNNRHSEAEISALRRALESTNRELLSLINGYNQKLKEGICSSDLDEPDYVDYQTVHDNDVLLAKYSDGE